MDYFFLLYFGVCVVIGGRGDTKELGSMIGSVNGHLVPGLHINGLKGGVERKWYIIMMCKLSMFNGGF